MVLLKKSSSQAAASGAWDSIHVLEVAERGRTAKYKLTSTVILNLGTKGDALGSLDLAGNMTRQVEADMSVEADETHVANIGKLVEDMELKMRNLLRKSHIPSQTTHADFYAHRGGLLWQGKRRRWRSQKHTAALRGQPRQSCPTRNDQQHGPIDERPKTQPIPSIQNHELSKSVKNEIHKYKCSKDYFKEMLLFRFRKFVSMYKIL